MKALSFDYVKSTGGYFKDRFHDSTRSRKREARKKLGDGDGTYSRHHLICERPMFYTLHAPDLGLDPAFGNWMGAFDRATVAAWREVVFAKFEGPVVGRLEVGGRNPKRPSHGRLHAHVIADPIDGSGITQQAVKEIHDLAGLSAYFSKEVFLQDHVVHGLYLSALRKNALIGVRMPPLHLKRGVPNSVSVAAAYSPSRHAQMSYVFIVK